MPLLKVSFEVFGRVQGVHFRAHTAKNARRLGLTGWCMNTTQGTVTGEIEGPQEAVNEMKHWLENTGSPSSRIDRITFSKPVPIEQAATEFVIRRPCRSKAQHPRHEADLINRSQGLRPPDSPTGSFDRKVASFADAKVRDAQGNERARDGEASSQLEPSASDASQETPADFGTSKLHLAQWYLAETGKPTFLAVEAVLAVAFLGLLDGGLSGDWLKYGYVNGDTQNALTVAACLGSTFHAFIATLTARQAASQSGNLALAAARGFLCGTPELLRVWAEKAVAEKPQA